MVYYRSMVLALNTTTGLISDVPPHLLEHHILKEVLVAVDENADAEVTEDVTVEEKATSRSAKVYPTPTDATTTKDEN
jgi:hypothetical protein